jgi:branched-subunit amino acid permease
MSLNRWWLKKNAKSKTITVLAALLLVEIGLCFSTPVTVAPAYEALFGPSHDSELALGLQIYQFFLWLITLAMLGAVAVLWHRNRDSGKTDEEEDD